MSGQNWLRRRSVVYNPLPRPVQQPKRFHVGRILWEALKRTAMLFGFIMLISIVVGAWSASRVVKSQAPTLPSEMILLLDTTDAGTLRSRPARYLEEFGLAGSSELSVPAMVDMIDAGAKDSRVKSLALILGDQKYGLSDYQELREAVIRFKASKKPVSAYADSFGGGGSGLGFYYLASAADSIWMQPVGVVAIPGMSAQMPFFRGLLEKVGVKPEFFQRKEYKTAMEHFAAYEMSEASREQMVGMIGDIGDQLTGKISESRKTKFKTDFKSLIDQGLFTDEEALQNGLIDKIGYQDEFVAMLRERSGGNTVTGKPDFISLEEYASVPRHKLKSGPVIARITVDGMITEGGSSAGPYGLEQELATSGEIVAAIMQAAEDDDIKAILIRINSPGGTPTAAESIHRAITQAKSRYKKPVYVSMGAMAASGGYWIAAPADRIYALDGTLTGSIGVVGGKFDASGLWEKLNVRWEEIPYGKNSSMWSFNKPFSESERERFEASLDNVYVYFIKRVTDGRKLKPEQVEAVAKGHVWTGRQAIKIGLVDVIGGQDKALDDIAVKLGQKTRDDLRIVDLPKPESKLEAIMSLLKAEASLSDFLPESTLRSVLPVLIEMDGRFVYEPVTLQ